MKQRCDNKNHSKYKYYGGRGITYDSKWRIYSNFKKDMYLKYILSKIKHKNKKIELDRIDNNQNYCKKNCRFITSRKNKQNTSKNKWFIITNIETGETFESNTMRKFSRDHGIGEKAISHALNGRIQRPIYGIWKVKWKNN